MQWIRWFRDLTIDDVTLVGGKNASLGEMIRELSPKGIQIPDGYAVTAKAYFEYLRYGERLGLGIAEPGRIEHVGMRRT